MSTVMLLVFILQSQFVQSANPDGLYKVIKGSGMGTEISGDLCDLVFVNLVEHDLLKPDSLNYYCISTWLRYRDDIFFAQSISFLYGEDIFSVQRRHLCPQTGERWRTDPKRAMLC